MMPTASSMPCSVTIKGGSKRSTLSPAATARRPAIAELSNEITYRWRDFDACYQPLAPQFDDEVGEALGQLLQMPGQDLPHLFGMFDKARLQNPVEHGIADSAGHRIAAIGRAMRARHHAFGHLFGGKAGAEGEAAADRLRRWP